MSLPAVFSVDGLRITDGAAWFGDREIRAGERVSVDGANGLVYAGALPLVAAPPDPRVDALLHRCDQRRRVPVLAVDRAAEWADGVLDSHTVVVARADDLDAIAGASCAVVAPADPDGAVSLVSRAVAAANGARLVFRVPDRWPPALRALPPGPWSAIAATDRGQLAARLLAAVVGVTGD
jgi:hypothetical protein